MQLFKVFAAALFSSSVVLAGPFGIGGCDVSDLTIDPSVLVDSTGAKLDAPTDKLLTIVMGSGSQNYSCQNGVATANGAVANLYDISCLVKNDATINGYLTQTFLHTDPNAIEGAMAVMQSTLRARFSAGYHYFKDDFTTPAFDIFVAKTGKQEKFVGSVAQKIAAPATADKGVPGNMNGAVAYLKLLPKTGYTSTLSTIYRLYTAGGQPPAGTCNWTGQKQIPYTAQYWIFKA